MALDLLGLVAGRALIIQPKPVHAWIGRPVGVVLLSAAQSQPRSFTTRGHNPRRPCGARYTPRHECRSCAGTQSNISLTLSPIGCCAPPQHVQSCMPTRSGPSFVAQVMRAATRANGRPRKRQCPVPSSRAPWRSRSKPDPCRCLRPWPWRRCSEIVLSLRLVPTRRRVLAGFAPSGWI
jgi:hypothetical protein